VVVLLLCTFDRSGISRNSSTLLPLNHVMASEGTGKKHENDVLYAMFAYFLKVIALHSLIHCDMMKLECS